MPATEPEWLRLNRANWDERVAIHLAHPSYRAEAIRAGHRRLDEIAEMELGPVAGLKLLHLQCHFGLDTLTLAQRGAIVTGLDFSPDAIATARRLAAETGLPATFVEADFYRTREVIQGQFDRVFITWGTIVWLPDIAGWARVVASMLAPGGELYFAEGHPVALVFDSAKAEGGMPGWCVPYFHPGPSLDDNPRDYADPEARLVNVRTHQFIHPVAGVVQALLDAGLHLTMLHEHKAVTWRMFDILVEGVDGLFRWPDRAWLPLAYSLKATKS